MHDYIPRRSLFHPGLSLSEMKSITNRQCTYRIRRLSDKPRLFLLLQHEPHVMNPYYIIFFLIAKDKKVTNSFYGHSDQNEIVQGNLRVKYVPCQRGNHSTWKSNFNLYSTCNSNISLVFNLEFQF